MLATLAALALAQMLPVVPPRYRAPAPKPSTVVAKVNGVAIKASDVEAALWEWRGPEVTEELISLVLVRQLAKKDGVTVTPAEVETQLAQNMKLAEEQKKANLQDPNRGMTAAEALAQQGYPAGRLYLRSEIEATINKIALLRFKPANYVKVSTMIFRSEGGSAAAVSSALKKAQAAHDRLVKGETWDKVMSDSGADQTMMKTHGLLGWRALSAFPTALQAAIKALKVGGYSEPYQLPAGFQMFRVEQFGATASKADLADLKSQFVSRERQTIVQNLRSNAQIKRFPTKEPGSSNSQK